MSYGYGGGPNWPMIQARRRAESAANSARAESAAQRASAQSWKTAFESLADKVRAAVVRADAEHRTEGACGCPSCWEQVITRLAQQAGNGAGPVGGAGPGFDLGDLFGRRTGQQ